MHVVLQSVGIAKDNKTILRSCQRHIHPAPIREKADPSVAIGSHSGKHYYIALPSLVSTTGDKENEVKRVFTICRKTK